MKLLTILLITAMLMVLLITSTAAISFAQTPGANASISGRVSSSNGMVVTGAQVMIVNAANTSEQIANLTMPVDNNGNYQFTNVPHGNIAVFAWSPHFASGLSNSISINENVTYTANVVLIPEPYYVNITTSENVIPLETGKATITFTVYDYWMNKSGPGWFITTYSTAGLLNPLYGDTDANSQFTTTLSAPMEGTMATINISARAKNGTYYPLQMIEGNNTTTTTTATTIPVPNATTNATATPVANATVTPVITATPAATPTASATPTPTPGFEVAAVLAGIGLAAAYRKFK
jgi:hypothetical protein